MRDRWMLWWFLAICNGVLALAWLDLAWRDGSAKNLLFALAWGRDRRFLRRERTPRKMERKTDTDETTAK